MQLMMQDDALRGDVMQGVAVRHDMTMLSYVMT